MLLECERGLGTVHVSLAAVPWELGFTLRGTRGTIRVDLARQSALLLARHRRPAADRGAADRPRGRDAQSAVGRARRVRASSRAGCAAIPGCATLVSRFYASVRDGLPPPVPFGDGVAVVAVLERVRLAARGPARHRPARR